MTEKSRVFQKFGKELNRKDKQTDFLICISNIVCPILMYIVVLPKAIKSFPLRETAVEFSNLKVQKVAFYFSGQVRACGY